MSPYVCAAAVAVGSPAQWIPTFAGMHHVPFGHVSKLLNSVALHKSYREASDLVTGLDSLKSCLSSVRRS